jgi:hypothetical protein
MKNLSKILLICLTSTMLAKIAVSASITSQYELENPLNKKSECKSASIIFEGKFLVGDSQKLEKELISIDKKCNNFISYPTVLLDSKGGDIEEAINVGRVIRKYEYKTTLYPMESFQNVKYGCYSSCVIAFIGGTSRLSELGVLGIHRPYFSNIDSKSTVKQIREQRENLNKKLKIYLNEMDVSAQLLEDMLAIPPEQMKILTSEEKRMYRLVGQDANYEEFRIARDARVFKMTSAEYRVKDLRANEACAKANERGICYLSNMLKISEEDARNKLPSLSICNAFPTKKDRDSCLTKLFN